MRFRLPANGFSVFLVSGRLPPLGWFAVVCTVAGSVLVAQPWRRDDAEKSLTGGVLLGLLAAVAAAAYKVLFKVVFDDPPPDIVGVILMWIGVYAATVGTGVLFITLGSGGEHVTWSKVPWGVVVAAHALSLVFNFLIGWGIAYTYPLFISLGTVLNVPLNIAADRVWRGELPSQWQGGGVGCI